jgi:hypothetical protein
MEIRFQQAIGLQEKTQEGKSTPPGRYPFDTTPGRRDCVELLDSAIEWHGGSHITMQDGFNLKRTQ